MIWIHYGLIAGSLTLAVSPSISTHAQSRSRTTAAPVSSQVTSSTGTASLEGFVLDAKTQKPIVGAVILGETQSGVISSRQTVGDDGAFQLTLDPKQSYLIKITAAGYEPLSERMVFMSSNTTTSTSTNRLYGKRFNLYKIGEKPPIHQNATTIESRAVSASSVAAPVAPAAKATNQSAASVPAGQRLTPPKTLDAKVVYTPPLVVSAPGKTTQLRAIQFVQSKAEFLPDAQPALEQLADFLRTNPTAEIELAGHTDNQGDFDENVRLSKQRVDVVKAYLVANGIAANRIVTRGYGPTRPIGSNNAENTRQMNRRVEMTILKQ